ncbi:MAG: single-stranded-DNA-specific exonuclease RecJ [Candidatus Pacebacteria bacterium]|nr:single-stranded-DNA-specific exonuclease RecJ [Candidatus Paceibacterota bacterium]MBP9851549.1 single-stranded-DNA-specific exonuclease RecJ [Candidatus Paceibacterota bacterium]
MHKFHELLRELLLMRGIKTEQEAEVFLNPDYERDMHDPFLMRDMEKACARIKSAIDKNEKIIVYADYDADGIPGAVILHDFFEKLNFKNYEVYIPARNSEGYGLNMEAIEGFREKNVNLIITIDLGITAIEEVALANSYGIDVIVTDHHLPHAELPNAFAILNPKTDEYPEKMLCGAGVAFKLVQGFVSGRWTSGEDLAPRGRTSREPEVRPLPAKGWEKWLLDMAGLATLSDMVPLLGENRAIAYFGMKVLRKSPRPGLQKLLMKMNIDQRYLAEDDIGFMVTPRLNAASRMDNPMRAYELLSTTDMAEAGVLADHLTKINDERKHIVLSIMKEVKHGFEKREMKDVIVVGNPKWKVGVLGLVAGKIMDEYERPVFVWGKDENDAIKGSCRSPGSVSVVELMTETKEYFMEFGGHEMAGGFTVHTEKVHFLEEALSENFHKVKRSSDAEGVSYDLKLDLNAVTKKNWQEISKMAPFGLGNPKPIFLFEQVKVVKAKSFGKNNSGEHLSLTVSNSEGKEVEAIAFFSGTDSFDGEVSEGAYLDLYATFDLSRFRGREELRLRIIDIL